MINEGEKAGIKECEMDLEKLKGEIGAAFIRQDVTINVKRANKELLRGMVTDLFYINILIFCPELKDVLNPVHLSGYDRPHCLENTRMSIRKEIDNWIQSTTSPNVFLLLGAAGTGKSTISTTIAEEYRGNGSLGCHLFFLRDKSDPTTVIRTIAYNLAVYNQNIAECINDALKDK